MRQGNRKNTSTIVWAMPVLPGKDAFVRQYFAERRVEAIHRGIVGEETVNVLVRGTLGRCAWLQHLNGQNYILHWTEKEEIATVCQYASEQMLRGDPDAIRMSVFYREVLGIDIRTPHFLPQTDCVAAVHLPFNHNLETECVSLAFAYPLQSAKTEEHKAFCRHIFEEQNATLSQYFQSLGIIRFMKFVQHLPIGDFIVYGQEVAVSCLDTISTNYRNLISEGPLKGVATALVDHTGLCLEDLSPDVEPLWDPKIRSSQYMEPTALTFSEAS